MKNQGPKGQHGRMDSTKERNSENRHNRGFCNDFCFTFTRVVRGLLIFFGLRVCCSMPTPTLLREQYPHSDCPIRQEGGAARFQEDCRIRSFPSTISGRLGS